MLRLVPHASLVSLAVGAALAMLSFRASAQSVSLQESSIARSAGFRSSNLNPTWISRADCLADDVISFPLTVSNYANYQLEVWVGGASNDCRTVEARSGSNPTCWKVWQGVPTSTNVTAMVHVRDIVAQNKVTDTPNGPGSGTIEDCTPESGGTTAPQAITLYFMLVDATSQQQVGGVAWSTKFDLVGPTPPTNLQAGVGDEMLVLEWDRSLDTDLVRYNFYCDPIPGQEDSSASTKPLDLDAGLDVAVDSAPASDASSDAGQDVMPKPTLDAASDSNTSSDTGSSSSSSSGASDCPTTVLVPGDYPDESHLCGSGTGTSGKITGLVNGVTYSIGIASVDGVGNVGKLSNVGCAAPQPVDDFYKLYRDAGGKAGGGFCAVAGPLGHGRRGSGLWWPGAILLMSLGWMVRRRRTR